MTSVYILPNANLGFKLKNLWIGGDLHAFDAGHRKFLE